MSLDAIPPYGWLEYCAASPGQPCHLGRPPTAQEAAVVNFVVNEGIRPVEDTGEDSWKAFPESREGDCDDYAVTKRAALISLGASPESLSLVTGEAIYPDGRRFFHVVIEYTVDGKTYVLDNLVHDLYTEAARPYEWKPEARQFHHRLYWTRSQ